MEKSTPFGRIEEISTEFGESACEILTVLSAEEHGIEELVKTLKVVSLTSLQNVKIGNQEKENLNRDRKYLPNRNN